jgi:hypothetical protein
MTGVFVAALLVGCGAPEGREGTADSARGTGEGSHIWPDPDAEARECLVAYPKDLRQQAYAFDGTVTAVHIGEYNESDGLPPVQVEVKINELFRGVGVGDRVALRTVENKAPSEEVVGTRILAATDYSLNLLGCGYTRPYSVSEASRWRQAFANVPAVECGKEVRDCDLGEPTPVPATCSRESLEYAIGTQIDQGGYPFTTLGCTDHYLSLRLDLGADACPPEATKRQRRDCARKKTAYFVKRNDVWDLITYGDETRCRTVQRLHPSLPRQLCTS